MNLIVNLTPTGMIPTKEQTPHVPITIKEIIEDVHRCYELGITMVHLHARDEYGEPTYKSEIYGAIIEGIRSYAPDLVICVSLSGRNFGELEKRSEPIQLRGDLKPDMGSLTLSSLNFPQQASINSPDMVKSLAKMMLEMGIVPELEIFDVGMANYAKYLIRKQFLFPPYYANLFVGNIASAQHDPLHLASLINSLPDDCVWSVGGIGTTQLYANTFSIINGGGVRVGLEDNILWDKSKLATNHASVERIHALASLLDREIMRPTEFRSLMNLQSGNGRYGREV